MAFLGKPESALFRAPAPPPEGAVFDLPLVEALAPTAVSVGVTPTLLADLTEARGSAGMVALVNLGPNTIYWMFSNSAARKPQLSVTTGFPLLATEKVVLDRIGGLAIWGITTVLQVSPADTRIAGGQ